MYECMAIFIIKMENKNAQSNKVARMRQDDVVCKSWFYDEDCCGFRWLKVKF
jgi:hypothetical protein